MEGAPPSSQRGWLSERLLPEPGGAGVVRYAGGEQTEELATEDLHEVDGGLASALAAQAPPGAERPVPPQAPPSRQATRASGTVTAGGPTGQRLPGNPKPGGDRRPPQMPRGLKLTTGVWLGPKPLETTSSEQPSQPSPEEEPAVVRLPSISVGEAAPSAETGDLWEWPPAPLERPVAEGAPASVPAQAQQDIIGRPAAEERPAVLRQPPQTASEAPRDLAVQTRPEPQTILPPAVSSSVSGDPQVGGTRPDESPPAVASLAPEIVPASGAGSAPAMPERRTEPGPPSSTAPTLPPEPPDSAATRAQTHGPGGNERGEPKVGVKRPLASPNSQAQRLEAQFTAARLGESGEAQTPKLSPARTSTGEAGGPGGPPLEPNSVEAQQAAVVFAKPAPDAGALGPSPRGDLAVGNEAPGDLAVSESAAAAQNPAAGASQDASPAASASEASVDAQTAPEPGRGSQQAAQAVSTGQGEDKGATGAGANGDGGANGGRLPAAEGALGPAQALPSVLIDPELSVDPPPRTQVRRQQRARAARATKATVRIELPTDLRLGSGGALSAPFLRPYSSRSRLPLRAIAIIVLAVVAGGAALLAWRSRDGRVQVEVSTVAGARLPEANIYVDGQLVCEGSPCVHALPPGVYRVRAQATGMAPTAEGSVQISPGTTLRHTIQMLPEEHSESGTLVVLEGPDPLVLSVDGRRIGELPQRLEGLEAGQHDLRMSVPGGGASLEKTIEIRPNEILQLQGQSPAKQGRIELKLGPSAAGATVTLDDATILDVPASLPLEAGPHMLRATKAGFEDFERRIEIGAGQVEEVEIQLIAAE